jgi:hypothetical protein
MPRNSAAVTAAYLEDGPRPSLTQYGWVMAG